jgi:predicted enzyme related to lactoylglutathione lyase
MNHSNVFLDSMSIATINTQKMVAFYETVFKTRLNPQRLGKHFFYTGPIGNIKLTLAPNELKGARASRSRYHLSFIVPNLEEHLTLAMQSGGMQTHAIDLDDNERYCEITDPDGNPIELIELI